MALENFDGMSALSLLVVFIMTCAFSSAVDVNQFIKKLQKPKGVIIGIFCQYILMPFMAFIIAYTFSDYLFAEQRIGLIIIGTMPGGSISNVFCFLFGADLTLSIAMTAMSSLSSFIFITINGFIYIPIISKGTNMNIDYISLLLSVAALICGVLCGLYISYKKWRKIQKFCGFATTIIFVFGVFVTFILNFIGNSPLWELSWAAWIAPLLLTSSAWVASFVIAKLAKLHKNSSVAVGIECSTQNTAFAIAILILTLDAEDADGLNLALGIPILYGTHNFIVVVGLGLIFKKLGYLETAENDKAMTFRKLFNKWREGRGETVDDAENAEKGSDTNEVQMTIATSTRATEQIQSATEHSTTVSMQIQQQDSDSEQP